MDAALASVILAVLRLNLVLSVVLHSRSMSSICAMEWANGRVREERSSAGHSQVFSVVMPSIWNVGIISTRAVL